MMWLGGCSPLPSLGRDFAWASKFKLTRTNGLEGRLDCRLNERKRSAQVCSHLAQLAAPQDNLSVMAGGPGRCNPLDAPASECQSSSARSVLGERLGARWHRRKRRTRTRTKTTKHWDSNILNTLKVPYARVALIFLSTTVLTSRLISVQELATTGSNGTTSELTGLGASSTLAKQHPRRQVVEARMPPTRALPARTILLEGGATTLISSLDEFLAQTTTEDPLAGQAGATSWPQDEERRAPLVQPIEQEEALALSSSATESREDSIEQHHNPNQEQHHNQHQEQHHDQNQEQHHNQHQEQHHDQNQEQHHNQHQEQHHGHAGSHQTEAHATNATNKPIPQHWQVKSLLNVTHDYPLAYSQIICGYVWPMMAAITLFTNLMIVFVLTQRDMRTPTNVVLMAIAIADIIPIVVPVPWFVYLFAMNNDKQVLYPPIACYFYQHSTRSVSEIFYFLSTWLNVLLAIQDYLTACQPKVAEKYCQIRVVVIEIVLLTLLAFLLNLPQALKLVFKPVKFYYNGQLTWGCKAMQAKWFKDLVGEYVALYDDIFTAIIVVFVDGGPALVLIILTALLIRQLQRQRIQGHRLMEQARTASKRRRERHRQQESEASARVMIFVLLAFLAVKIPFATTYTLMIIQSRFDIHFVENLVDFQKAITLTDLVFVLSYPINFTIFCCCSKKFRHKCAQLLSECDGTRKTIRGRLWSSFSSVSGLADDHHQSLAARKLHHNKRADSLAAANSHRPHAGAYPGAPVVLVGAKQDGAELAGLTGQQQVIGGDAPPDRVHEPSVCPARAHRRRLGEPAGDSVVDLKSLLTDGSLCIECIVRYEQAKRAAGPSGAPGDLFGCNPAAGSRTASQSSDSLSWATICQPPAISSALHQLPSIVTTRCESLTEPDSLGEPTNGPGQTQTGANAKPDTGARTGAGADSDHLGRTTLGGRLLSDPGSDLPAWAPNTRRASARHSGGARASRRRSLSLSSSNLKTLPNATGLLADMFVSALVGASQRPDLGPNKGGPKSSDARSKI